MKALKNILIIALIGLFPLQALALTQAEAFEIYRNELIQLKLNASISEKKAKQDIEAMIEGMEASQYDLEVAFNALEVRVSGLLKNDNRREAAKAKLEETDEKVKKFTQLEAQNHLEVQESIAGALPRLLTTTAFEQAQKEAIDAMAEVNQILINPDRPGNVPDGSVNDFISQLVRQLFRFAWLAILITWTISGIFLIIAKENEDRISKAKSMIYFSLIGSVVIAMAFAIVKGITDIDFFNFI